MPGKRILWVGTALNDLKDFPENARREAGHALHLVQLGQEPPDWRPMSTVGPGAIELRVHAESEYRVIYVARFAEGIYVLHAFLKRSRPHSAAGSRACPRSTARGGTRGAPTVCET